jgi:putative heme iron utilization protein
MRENGSCVHTVQTHSLIVEFTETSPSGFGGAGNFN